MKKDYTYIGCVLDRSGSMGSMGKIEEARSGFNNFLQEQKKLEGSADINVIIFDNDIEKLYDGSIDNCPELTPENFFPRGMTAYLDALGTTIDNIGSKLSAMKEENRPEKVIVLVITDGLENASQEYTPELIKGKIETQRLDYNWEFVFMGADEKSIEDAKSYGIAHTMSYSNDVIGVRNSYAVMSEVTSSYRSFGVVDMTDAEDNDNE